VAESSSARVSLSVEKMMDLETCWYMDFLGVWVIDIEVPQLPEKEYEVAAKRPSNEPMIIETIVSISKAPQEYERVGSFASAATTNAEDGALAAPAAHMELTEDASVPPQVNKGWEASPHQPMEAAGAPAPVAESGAA
jgi:hypothetical protein